jgi:hypothetical protein
MRRRAPVTYAPLTSLLDVLFILVFASLIHSAALEKQAAQAAAAAAAPAVPPKPPTLPATPPPVPPRGVQAAAEDPAVRAAREAEALRRAAMSQIVTGLEGRGPVVARIDREGRLLALERMRDGRVVVTPLGLPLIERVPDPDIGLVYLGERRDGPSLCSLLRLHLGARDLSDSLVIVALDAPRAQLSVALARGLERDAERCLAEQRGIAVIVYPRDAQGAGQQGGAR